MTEREKVKAGLECLTHVDEVVYKRECKERQCPYRNMDCEIAVMEDAYNLLTELTKYDGLEIDPPHKGLNGSAIIIDWRHPKMGFGQFKMWWDDDQRLHMDTESMSDEFVQAVLAKLVAQMVREG